MSKNFHCKIYLFLGLIVCAILLLSVGCGRIEVDNKSEELPDGMLTEKAPDLSKRPDGLAEAFLKCIKTGKYTQAYNFFGMEARGQISRDSFVSSLQRYMSTASTKRSYLSRVVKSERVVGTTGIVEVADSASPNSKVWIWEFEKNYEGWKIRSLDLPPIMRHRERYSY